MKGFVAAALGGLMLSAAWAAAPAAADEALSILGAEISTEALDGTRAKGAVDIDQDAHVENNGWISGNTGINEIGSIGGAGLMNISQNSGNNVSIQQSIGVNVTLGGN